MSTETKESRGRDKIETVGDLDPDREVVKFSSWQTAAHLPEHVDECNSLPAPEYARRTKAAVQFDDIRICMMCRRAESARTQSGRGGTADD